MYTDAKFEFRIPTVTGTNRAASHADYIHDAGSAKVLFGAAEKPCFLWGRLTITADASPAFLVDLVASDESDLDPNLNASPKTTEILASTGIVSSQQDGGVLATGDTVEFCVPIQLQRVARRYYGLHVLLAGTNPAVAANQKARVVLNAQTNMIGARAAAPA